jgi:hypothetical protein
LVEIWKVNREKRIKGRERKRERDREQEINGGENGNGECCDFTIFVNLMN